MPTLTLRPMTEADRFEVAELIYASINVWYQQHGRPPIFAGGPRVTEIFYDVYNALEPGCAVVAENPQTGRLMGSCFYHPRQLRGRTRAVAPGPALASVAQNVVSSSLTPFRLRQLAHG
jgi:hypothetical protein